MISRTAMIIGAGGHAISVAETVTAAGFFLEAFIDERGSRTALLGRPVLTKLPSKHVMDGGILVIAVGDNDSRELLWHDLAKSVPEHQLPAVAHPSASISLFADLAPGCVILQGAVVASKAQLGTGCLINSGAVVEHECVLDEFVSLAPRAVLGGQVSIGARSAVAIGAVIKNRLSIGSDVFVGAGSYVHKSLPNGVTAYGVPARIVRRRHDTESSS